MKFTNIGHKILAATIVIGSVFGFFSILFKIINHNPEKTTISKTNCKIVKEIGGCDSNYCGVKFQDGSYSSYASRPVLGATMCGIKINNTELYIIKERE